MIAIALMAQLAHAYTVDDFAGYADRSLAQGTARFATTYSPCLDALVVNFSIAGCDSISRSVGVLGVGSIGLSCVGMDERGINGWTLNEHAIFYTRTHTPTDIPGWDVFCFDPHITMYIPEGPRLAK
jgi:hypothetical protein